MSVGITHEIANSNSNATTGASMKETNRSGQTPLHVASSSNNIRAIEFLLETCSDTCTLRDRCGRTPFMYSVASGSLETSRMILSANQDVLNMIDRNGMTALHVACERNSIDLVTMLLSQGADVNIADRHGVTPLHVACHDQDADSAVIGDLIRSGSRVDVCDAHGLTPLHIMCARGRYDVIRDIFRMSSKEYLLPRERSSTLDIRGALHFADAKGWNVSHFASSSNNIELLGLLMDIGCDVNRKAKDGVTPLHIASTKCSNGSCSVVFWIETEAACEWWNIGTTLSLFLSLNTHNTQTTQIHVASQNKNIRKMLTTS